MKNSLSYATIGGMVDILILLIIILAVGYVAFWFIDQGIPEPMRMIAKLLVAVLALLAIFKYVLPVIQN